MPLGINEVEANSEGNDDGKAEIGGVWMIASVIGNHGNPGNVNHRRNSQREWNLQFQGKTHVHNMFDHLGNKEDEGSGGEEEEENEEGRGVGREGVEGMIRHWEKLNEDSERDGIWMKRDRKGRNIICSYGKCGNECCGGKADIMAAGSEEVKGKIGLDFQVVEVKKPLLLRKGTLSILDRNRKIILF